MKAFIIQPNEKIFNSLDARREKVVGRIIEKIDWEHPEGILTYIKGFEYPVRGYPYPEVARVVAILKRSFIGALKLPAPLLLFAYLFKWSILDWITDYGLVELQKFVLKPDRFCRSGRELGRVFAVFQNAQTKEKRSVLIGKLSLIIQMIWEYDNGYRYPGQLIFGEIKEKSVKGLQRAIEAYLAQEKNNERKKKIQKITKLLWFFKKPIEKFLKEADLNELKADEMDMYFINKKRKGE